MLFEVLSPLDFPDWNSRLTRESCESVFSTIEWTRVLCETYGFSPCYLTSRNGDSPPTILPMMEVDSWLTGRRGVSLPFSDFCVPSGVDSANSADVIRELVRLGTQRRWRYFEVRNDRGVPASIPRFATHFTHVLDLSAGETVLFDQLRSSVRTSIRKAQRAGVEIEFSDSLASVREFYRLNCLTRRRHGLAPQPFRFFENLQRHMLAKGMGHVALGRHGGYVVAAAVFLNWDCQVLFKYGASDDDNQQLRATNLLMWESIRRYAHAGYRGLSFGRTAEAHSGLRRFKLGWGAKEGQIGYVKYDFRRQRFARNGLVVPEAQQSMVCRLPLFVLRWGGALLYRHMA